MTFDHPESGNQRVTVAETFTGYSRRVVHDVANAANAISTHLQLIELLAAGNDALQAPLGRALLDIDRLIATLKARLYLPPMPISSESSAVAPASLIQRLWDQNDAQADLDNQVDKALQWEVSESLLCQALTPILDNAIQASSTWVRCRVSSAETHRRLCVENPVSDVSNWQDWQQAFFTTRSHAGALGLGINMAEHAMEQMGGRLDLAVREGVCRVVLTCP